MVKAHLRAVEPRTKEALHQAIGEAVGRVTGEAARAFFTHCGYPIAPADGLPQQQ
jgi:hypothetical protein